MQGKRSEIGSLPDSIDFNYGSTSNNMGIDQQICWNTLQNPTEAMLSECHTTPGGSGSIMGTSSQKTRNLSRWNIGEPSSRNLQNPVNHDERVCQDGWPSSMAASSEVAGSRLEDHNHVYDQISAVTRNGVDSNLNGNQVLNTSFSNNGSTSSAPFASSGSGGFLVEEEDNRPDYVLDGRRLSCKRKNIEGNAGNGQSSSSSTSMWQALPPPTNNGNGTLNASTRLGAPNPRLRLSIGGVAQDNVYVPNTGVRVEPSRRNYRVRVNPRTEQDSFPNPSVLPQVTEGHSDVPVSHRPLRYVPINPPGSQRNVQRMQEGNTPLHQDLNSRPVPRNISEHPMFMPSVEVRNSSAHNPTAWNINGTSRNVAPSYRAGPGIGPQSSSGPTWGSHRQASSSSSSQYSRRLSEYVRRSLLSSASPESVLHYGPASAHRSAPSSSSSTFQEVILPTGGGAHGYGGGAHGNGDGIHGIPYSLRGALAAGGEGRSRLVSEHIRSVLDMMRRGEGLRFEHYIYKLLINLSPQISGIYFLLDVMILNPSVFFGMADIHDEHRDMRLDVDNMSYEELLALEERIGNVSTGLAEEKIVARLKQKRYTQVNMEGQGEVEPCCICQEVYKNGEEMGALDCGHDFHAKCIKQWLQQKNSCPIFYPAEDREFIIISPRFW
ncbi:hypothetical protein V2J09_007132 [Rumex salicifolius]